MNHNADMVYSLRAHVQPCHTCPRPALHSLSRYSNISIRQSRSKKLPVNVGKTPTRSSEASFSAIRKDNFFLTLAAGPEQVSWRKLRAHLGVSRISMATEEEVLGVTGYAVGTVSPLGLAHPTRILADIAIFTQDEISLGSGVRGVAIIMKSADLKRALGEIEVGQFC